MHALGTILADSLFILLKKIMCTFGIAMKNKGLKN